MDFLWGMSSSVGNHHRHPDDEHREAQQLSASKRSKVKADLGVRLADKFHKKAKESIETDQAPKDRSRIQIFSIKYLI